jgi:tRNA threonylcarbamoyl adenosine modification protein (Sua5/YciO/YrdC/YwlC family)
MVTTIKSTPAFLQTVATVLARGSSIVIPTDTVYGLACDATQPDAVEHLRKLKGTSGKPFTLFMQKGSIEEYAVVTKHNVIEYFVPGPITVILKARKAAQFPGIDDTIGIRIPDNDFVITLLNTYRKPLAVTSANKAGAPPLTVARDIAREFPDIELIVDAGKLRSEPSTVVDLTKTPPVVMRKGVVPIMALEKVYGHTVMLDHGLRFNVLFVCTGNSCRSPMAEGILKTMVDEKYCTVKSAGTLYMSGMPASEYAQDIVREYGGSIATHQTQPITPVLIGWADLILVMEYKHYTSVIEIAPQAAVKTFLLKEYKRKTQHNKVQDPIGKDRAFYEKTARDMLPSLRFVAHDVMRRFEK